MSDRLYPQRPICGVGAFVIGTKGVLMARRDKDPGKGSWSVPGGAVELGETQEEAVKREILEETGVHIEVIKFLDTVDLIIHDQSGKIKFHYILNHYLARPLDSAIHPEFSEGEVAWFPLDALPRYEMPELLWKAFLKHKTTFEQIQTEQASA